MHKKYGTDCDPRNRILAKSADSWLMGRVEDLVASKIILEHAVERAHLLRDKHLQPQKEAWARLGKALRENQKEIDTFLATVTWGRLDKALVSLLNQRARELKWQRDNLLGDKTSWSGKSCPVAKAGYRFSEKTIDEFSGLGAESGSG